MPPGLLPAHDLHIETHPGLHIETHPGGEALMKRKASALRSIGIDWPRAR